MRTFRILFHGRFAEADDRFAAAVNEGATPRCGGFYASRTIPAADLLSAIARGKELIRLELDDSLLHHDQRILAVLEAEEWEAVDSDDGFEPINHGFTFY
jgi:hypothetical protein